MVFDQDNCISILFLLKAFKCFRNGLFDRYGKVFFLPLKVILNAYD